MICLSDKLNWIVRKIRAFALPFSFQISDLSSTTREILFTGNGDLGSGSLFNQSEYRKKPMMPQEEQNQMCSNNISGGVSGRGGGGCGSGGNRSSKKMKQKKIPQRGLGVAQLEMLRIQDQQQKAAENAVGLSPPTLSHTNSSLAVSFLNYSRNQSSSSSIPIHPPSPPTLPSPNRGQFDVGWPSIPVTENPNFPKMCRPYEFNRERDNSKLDHASRFRSNMNPNLMPSTQYQQPYSSVNISPMNPSSLPKFQTEPPSNQSYYSTFRSPWPEEEKIAGMKRPYPFLLENPPAPPFIGKYPPISRLVGMSEPGSCENGSTLNLDNSVPIFGETQCGEEGISGGEFLTLAPPTATSPYASTRYKHSSAYVSSHSQGFYHFESSPYQINVETPVIGLGPGGSSQLRFFRFFPTSKVEDVATTTNSTGELRESVDLELKL
ncbi:hypothetical protein Nepgr_026774 [Nepenthes gracilis]|uniref:Uncharacterized protein n=1 Tax=Nepenthes gracilis TaxID=150966 RepID=A0AAD3Y2U8_NEPGR|nr:hypothetical protein Nepgr_026774 [Nepenthes gracilis]